MARHQVTFNQQHQAIATEIIAQTVYRCGTMSPGQIYAVKQALDLSDAEISRALRWSVDRVDELQQAETV